MTAPMVRDESLRRRLDAKTAEANTLVGKADHRCRTCFQAAEIRKNARERMRRQKERAAL